jgi:hypothetical protein
MFVKYYSKPDHFDKFSLLMQARLALQNQVRYANTADQYSSC